MDLWDLTKLLFRRWYAFVPMLVASVIVVVVVSSGIKPDYSAVGHLQLIPPGAATTTTDGPKRPPNPWMNLGFPALANAVVLKITDPKALEEIVKAGYTDNFTVTVEYNTTYFVIEAVGTSEAQATGTVRRIMKLLDEGVAAQQAQFGVAKQDSITTLPLDSGEKVSVLSSKQTRVFIVAAGIAVLFSIAMTVAIDVLLRTRARRRSSAAPAEAVAASPPPRPNAARVNGTAEPVTNAGLAKAAGGQRTPLNRPAQPSPSEDLTELIPLNGNTNTDRSQVTVEYRHRIATESAPPPAVPDDIDATVIIPLSRTHWAGREGKST